MAWHAVEPEGEAPERPAERVAVLEALAAREREALYPEVLLAPRAGDPAVVYRRERDQSRLITVALLHGRLTPWQHAAIAGFRLRQYTLCGLYDAHHAARDATLGDPSMETLAAPAIHVCCGTPDGRLLSYMCMETARHRTSMPGPVEWPPHVAAGASRHRPSGAPGYVLGAAVRPLFATEFELFGSSVFSSLPYLRQMDVTQARELSRMLRNQVVVSPLSVAAMIEIVLAMHHLVTDPALGIAATLGCLGREGRILMAQLGVPLLFAPDAPVLPHQVARARATRGSSYWSNSANAPGQFWPFVIASDDLRRHARHFARLDELLTLPIAELRRALVNVRRAGRMIEPETLLPGLEGSSIRWTADPADGSMPDMPQVSRPDAARPSNIGFGASRGTESEQAAYHVSFHDVPHEVALGEKVGMRLRLERVPTAKPDEPGVFQLPLDSIELICTVNANGVEGLTVQTFTLPLGDSSTEALDYTVECVAIKAGSWPFLVQVVYESSDRNFIECHSEMLPIEIASPTPVPDSFELPVLLGEEVALPTHVMLVSRTPLPKFEPKYEQFDFRVVDLRKSRSGNLIISDVRRLSFTRHAHLIKKIEQLYSANASASPHTANNYDLLELGSLLARQILPRKVRRLLAENAGIKLSWIIITDPKSWVPWELFDIGDNTGHQSQGEPAPHLWGQVHHIGRWIPGTPLHGEFPSGRYAYLYPGQTTLSNNVRPPAIASWLKARTGVNVGTTISDLLRSDQTIHECHVVEAVPQSPVLTPALGFGQSQLLMQDTPDSGHLYIRGQRPLVTLNLAFENSNAVPIKRMSKYPYLSLEFSNRAMPFVKAGASAVVGTFWPVEPSRSDVFFSTFYSRMEEGASLGEAIHKGKEAVRGQAPNSADWAAFTLFGHPESVAYVPEFSEGYAMVEVFGGAKGRTSSARCTIRATLRARAPLSYAGRLVRVQELPAQPSVMIFVPALQQSDIEAMPLRQQTSAVLVANMPTVLTTYGRYKAVAEFRDGTRHLRSLHFNYDFAPPLDNPPDLNSRGIAHAG